jgi:hypothetical protein
LAEKGGALSGIVAELVAEDAESARGIAEASGHFDRRELFEKVGAQGLVLSLEGVLG